MNPGIEDAIEVEFALSKRDYRAAARLYHSQRRIRWLPRLGALMLVGLALAEIVAKDYVLVLMASMGIIFILSLPFIVLWIQSSASHRRSAYAGALVRLLIKQDELHIESLIGESTIRHLMNVVDARDGILCYLDKNMCIFIPRRAFGSDEQHRIAVERLKGLTLPVQYGSSF